MEDGVCADEFVDQRSSLSRRNDHESGECEKKWRNTAVSIRPPGCHGPDMPVDSLIRRKAVPAAGNRDCDGPCCVLHNEHTEGEGNW